jgi:hypothetical protein
MVPHIPISFLSSPATWSSKVTITKKPVQKEKVEFGRKMKENSKISYYI